MSRVEIAGVDTSALPKISNAEQLVMLAKIRGGDKECRAEFIRANMRLVLSVIQRYINKKGASDDVFQVGCIGLIKAIDNFDPRFNVQFSTYAVPMIVGEIRRFLRDTNSLRVSRSLRDTAYRALVAKDKLTKLCLHEPSIDEIAREIDMPYKSVYFALSATSNTVSLDDVITDEAGKGVTMMDKMAVEGAEADKWIEDVMLQTAIKSLSEREREILVMRYFWGKTQVEVSNDVGISQAQVSRLEKNALEGIRKELE
jgi:RNA polymerase sporulation-specific sigma factor